MSCELRERDFEGFFRTPFEAYPADSPYVSPMKADLGRLLDPRRNPFYGGPGEGTHFTAYRDGVPVGRVSAHVHHDANRRHRLSRGFFGFFDVADDAEAAGRLLERAESWVRARGCTEIAGNFNLTAVQEIGVVTGGHHRAPYTAMHWSPPHVARHLEARAYDATFPMTTWELALEGFDPACLLGPAQRELLASGSLAWTRLGRRSFRRRSEDVRRILNASFAHNPHFVPVSRAEFDFQAAPLTWIVDPRLSMLVDHDGEPAGVTVCIPDQGPFLRSVGSRARWSAPYHFLRHRRGDRRAVVVFSGVVPRLQNAGLCGAMLHRITRALKKAGYARLGITWVSRGNGPSLRFMEKMGARPLHELAIYRRTL